MVRKKIRKQYHHQKQNWEITKRRKQETKGHRDIFAHSDATTYDAIAYIKLIISQKSDIVITYSGVNDLTKDMNMMSMAQKVAAAVKEIDTKGKLKLIFSGVYC